jgi:hypothetical protein
VNEWDPTNEPSFLPAGVDVAANEVDQLTRYPADEVVVACGSDGSTRDAHHATASETAFRIRRHLRHRSTCLQLMLFRVLSRRSAQAGFLRPASVVTRPGTLLTAFGSSSDRG